DVAEILKQARAAYDAILLDVDNGPEAFTHRQNNWLYGRDGLNAAYAALRPRGLLAVWSAGPSPDFVGRLHKAGFEVEEMTVRGHGKRGPRHVIWFARRPA
ncbi:MAG: spermidine synthase, partial [Gammaproteobacteria bacterium]|nr:spermidine synthase [Gammaproteobacteria bacterium]